MNCAEYYFFQCFTHEKIKKINKEIKKYQLKKEDPADTADTNKKGNFYHIPCLNVIELLNPWLEICQKTNRNYIGFNIDWQFNLDILNYNVYEENDEYEWHIDAVRKDHPGRDIKLTCLLNLSEEPYEGGKFHLINRNKEIEFTSGMGLVFNPLIAHKVTPVTKGKRITMSYWAQGPPWV